MGDRHGLRNAERGGSRMRDLLCLCLELLDVALNFADSTADHLGHILHSPVCILAESTRDVGEQALELPLRCCESQL